MEILAQAWKYRKAIAVGVLVAACLLLWRSNRSMHDAVIEAKARTRAANASVAASEQAVDQLAAKVGALTDQVAGIQTAIDGELELARSRALAAERKEAEARIEIAKLGEQAQAEIGGDTPAETCREAWKWLVQRSQ